MLQCAGVRKSGSGARKSAQKPFRRDCFQYGTDVALPLPQPAEDVRGSFTAKQQILALEDIQSAKESDARMPPMIVRANSSDFAEGEVFCENPLPPVFSEGQFAEGKVFSERPNPWVTLRKADVSNAPILDNASVAVNDSSSLSEVLKLTQELKDQMHKLQSDASEQKDKVATLENEISELRSASAMMEAKCQEHVAFTPRDLVVGTPQDALCTPRDEGSPLRRGLNRIFGRSPSRSLSNSPQKNIRVEFRDTVEYREAESTQSVGGCCSSNASSPERSRSPTRKIEARLAPRIFHNVTNFLDGQIQNLELRMATMERSFENWRQTTIPNGAVDRMSAADLHMLSGLNVVQSRDDCLNVVRSQDDTPALLDSVTEPAWDTAPRAASTRLPRRKGRSICKSSSRRSEQTTSLKRDPSQDEASDKVSSWKTFSRLFVRSKGRRAH